MFVKFKIFFLSTFLKFILNGLFLTCTLKSNKNQVFQSCLGKKAVLLSIWHHQGLLFAHYIKKHKLPSWAISSTHADSEILARILTAWKIRLIRGSSTRGWVNVIKKMITLYKKTPAIITITPDGPRGPRKQAKTGAFSLAKKHNVMIFSVSASASQYWSLPSWDKTIIPKPFSTIYVNIEEMPIENEATSQTISIAMDQSQQNNDK